MTFPRLLDKNVPRGLGDLHGAPGVLNTTRWSVYTSRDRIASAAALTPDPRGHPLIGGDSPTTSSLDSLQGIRSREEGTCGQERSRIRAGRQPGQLLPITGGFLEEGAVRCR